MSDARFATETLPYAFDLESALDHLINVICSSNTTADEEYIAGLSDADRRNRLVSLLDGEVLVDRQWVAKRLDKAGLVHDLNILLNRFGSGEVYTEEQLAQIADHILGLANIE